MKTPIVLLFAALLACLPFFSTPPARLLAESPKPATAWQGEEPNGLCCRVGAGALCDNLAGNGGCQAPLPWQCYCTNPGSSCVTLGHAPSNHDTCDDPNPAYPGMNCSLVQTYCYSWLPGTCHDDGGDWSWLGFCTMCGCVRNAEPEEFVGSKNVCAAGSSGC